MNAYNLAFSLGDKCTKVSRLMLAAALISMPILSIYVHSAVGGLLLLAFLLYLFSHKRICHHRQQTAVANANSNAVTVDLNSSLLYWYLFFTLLVLVIALASLLLNGVNKIGISELERFLRLSFTYPLLLLLVKLRVNAKLIFGGAMFCGCVLLLLAPLEVKISQIDRINAFGTLNPIRFGANSSLFLFINMVAAIYFYRRRSYFLVAIAVVAAIGAVAALLLSGSRGALLAQLLLLPLALSLSILYKLYKELLVSALLLALVLPLLWAFDVFTLQSKLRYMQQTLVMQFEGFSEHKLAEIIEHNSVEAGDYLRKNSLQRKEMWRLAWQGFVEKPILGQGTGSFQNATKQAIDAGSRLSLPYNQAHNEYLNTLYSRGVLGFIALLGVFALPLVVAIGFIYRQNYTAGVLLLAVVGSYMIFSLTESMFTIVSTAEVYAFLVATFWAMGILDRA